MSDELDYDFSPTTPLYHEKIDDWGLSVGTRVWMAGGGFKPVQEIEEGDTVFGRGYQIETEYVERVPNAVDPTENLMKVWRPILVAREVEDVTTTEARAWEMTFGTEKKKYQARRLVAGGETAVRLFPDAHNHRVTKPMVRCHTAVENPRVGGGNRRAGKLDPGRSKRANEPRYQPTAFTGTPRGEQAVIVPYEAMGGQMDLIDTEKHGYSRYVYGQVREVVPVPGMSKTTLYQLHLQPDTDEELGVLEDQGPRCNVIAQTPFAGEAETREVITDPGFADRIKKLNSEIENSGAGDVHDQWDEYADDFSSPEGTKEKHTTYQQGQFYDTRDGEIGEALEQNFGIEDGWLNGGILLSLPVPDGFENDPEDDSQKTSDDGPATARPA